MKLKIPGIAIEGLIRLFAMNDDEANVVFELLGSIKPEMNWESLRAKIVAKPSGTEDAVKVFEAIKGLYELKLRIDQPIEDLVSDVVESAMENEALKDIISDKKKLSDRLISALSFNRTLGITAKAENVMSEHQNVYIDGRILTDLRPVFCEEIDEDKPVTTIIHNLIINYLADDIMKKMVFALDSNDLDKLEKIIARAKSKERVLKQICTDSSLTCLR